MAIIKPFRSWRPFTRYAPRVASRPYDVLNTQEAKKEAEGNPLSFLHVVKPEIDFPENFDPHAPEIYRKGKENFQKLCRDGILFQDKKECFYIYMLEINSRRQTGIVGCVSIDDYFNQVILKHELTRPDKEEDRINHIRVSGTHPEPVFFAYPYHKGLEEIIVSTKNKKPEYDFVADDSIRHVVWIIEDENSIQRIINIFREIPHTYVADGHHRTAAAAIAGLEMRKNNPEHTGGEEYNYLMAAHFPDNELQILDYNRLVRDLNGLSRESFLEYLTDSFRIHSNGPAQYKPQRLHEISMYLEGNWFVLEAKDKIINDADPIGVLDVTILYQHVLNPLLGIVDLRTDTRIDFVGGIRGLDELERRVNHGEMKAAFALYPVSMKQLMDIADTGNIMPPKTTWFEPKLRSGLFVHML